MRLTYLPVVLLATLTLPGCQIVEESMHFDLAGKTFDRAVIESRSGEVNVFPADAPAVDATLRYAPGRKPKPSVEVEDGALRVTFTCPPGLGPCGVSFDVGIPAGLPVEVDASSGGVDVTGMGTVTVDSSSGAVEVEDCAGPVTVDASSGGITARGIAADVDLNASSGGITVEAIDGDVSASSSSGGVSLSDIGGDLDLDVSSGAIHGDQLYGANARAECDSGGVDLSFVGEVGDVWVNASSGGISLTVPAGSYAVDADSDSGDVTITGIVQDPGADASLRAHTSSGDVRITGR